MKESDWKIFNRVKKQALERVCENALSDISESISEGSDSYHDQYLYVFKLIENTDKKISSIFDGHSRSRAQLQLFLMRKEGLVDGDELEGMSTELLNATSPSK